MKFIHKYWHWLAVFLAPLIMFYPSLSGFFTNDDFFFLKLARASSLMDFLNFFNPLKDLGAVGVYRPIPQRFIYFLDVGFFHQNPLFLHIVSFVTLFAIIILVSVLVRLLTKDNKIAMISAFLYAVSATHFGKLYYINQYQEFCMTLFFLASTIFFVKYELETKAIRPFRNLILSLLLFILCLMSKETAVTLPFILVLTHFYLTFNNRIKVPIKTLMLSLAPFFLILAAYLSLHFFSFGLVSGDSYIWNFSPFKAINTLSWYGLWSLNIPEMLVDFIGSGLHVNPDLFKYWSKDIIQILIFFSLQILVIFGTLIKLFKADRKNLNKDLITLVFSCLWFIVTLIPVLFLPVHKFTLYLTLPLAGTVFALSYLLIESKISKVWIGLFLAVWTITSILSLRLTVQTNWITRSQIESYKVYQYFKENGVSLSEKNVYFIDTKNDSNLPWSPTQVLKVVLGDKNFFDVFYPALAAKVNYVGLEKAPKGSSIKIIESRQFLGY